MAYDVRVFEIARNWTIPALVIGYRIWSGKLAQGPASNRDGGVTRDRRRKRGAEEMDKVGRTWGNHRKLETIQVRDG